MIDNQISIDVTARGWQDDGSESGILSVRPGTAPLVSFPLRSGATSGYQLGVPYESSGGATISNTFRTLGNADGTSQLLTITCPAADHSYVRLKFRKVRGRRFGVRWYFGSGSVQTPFTCWIDGVAYDVQFAPTNWRTGEVPTDHDPVAQWVCPDLLTDGEHDIDLVFLGDRPGGSSRNWILYGLLLDSMGGYTAPQRASGIYGPWTATVGWNTFAPSGVGWDANNVRVQEVFIFNGTGGAATVSFGSGAGADANRFMVFGSIPDGESRVHSFGDEGALWSPLYIKASAAVKIFVKARGL